LGRDDDVVARHQAVGDSDDGVAVGHGQRAAGAEVGLEVDQDQGSFHLLLLKGLTITLRQAAP
jgi:hypothetical protein